MGNEVSAAPLTKGLSERKYRKMIMKRGEAIAALSVDGYWFMNDSHAHMFGYNSAEEMEKAGTHPGVLSPPVQPDGMTSEEKANLLISNVLRSPSGKLDFDWDHLTRQKKIVHVHVYLSLLILNNKTGCQALLRYRDDETHFDQTIIEARQLDQNTNTNTDTENTSDTSSSSAAVPVNLQEALKQAPPPPKAAADNASSSAASDNLPSPHLSKSMGLEPASPQIGTKDRADSVSSFDLSMVDCPEMEECFATIQMMRTALLKVENPKVVSEVMLYASDLEKQVESAFSKQDEYYRKKIERLQERLKRERQLSQQRTETLEANLNKRLRALETTKNTQDTTSKDLKKMKSSITKTQAGLEELGRKWVELSSTLNTKKTRNLLKHMLQEMKEEEQAKKDEEQPKSGVGSVGSDVEDEKAAALSD